MVRNVIRRSGPPTRLELHLVEGERDVQAFRAETLHKIILAEVARQKEAAPCQEDIEASDENDADTAEEGADMNEDDADVGQDDNEVEEEDVDADEEDLYVDEEYHGPDSAH